MVSGGVYQAENGHGFNIITAKDVYLHRCKASLCVGDGFYVGVKDDYLSTNLNVNLIDCIGDNNRRQGLPITSGLGVNVVRGAYKNTGKTAGTAPRAGIDIEPNPNQGGDLDVTLTDVRTDHNEAYGLILALHNIHNCKLLPGRNYIQCDIKVSNYTSRRDYQRADNYGSSLRIVGYGGDGQPITTTRKLKGAIKFINTSLIEPSRLPFNFTNIGYLPDISFISTSITDIQNAVIVGDANPSASSLFYVDYNDVAKAKANYEYSKITMDIINYEDTRGRTYNPIATETDHRVKRPIFYNNGNPTNMTTPMPQAYWELNNFTTNIFFDENRMGTYTYSWSFGGSLVEQVLTGSSGTIMPDMPTGQQFICVPDATLSQVIRLPDADEYSVGQYLNYRRNGAYTERMLFECSSSDEIILPDGTIQTASGAKRYEKTSPSAPLQVPQGDYKFYCPAANIWTLIQS